MTTPTTDAERSGNAFAYPNHAGDAGLTKREAFAMAAMQGLLANGQGNYALPDRAASMAVVVADLLLAGLNQEPRT